MGGPPSQNQAPLQPPDLTDAEPQPQLQTPAQTPYQASPQPPAQVAPPQVVTPQTQPQTPAPPSQAQATQQQTPYDFIMEPEKPSRQFALAGTSFKTRLILAGGGLFALIIVLSIFNHISHSGPGLTPYVTVAQDQQELIHLASEVSQQHQSISVTSQNSAATTAVTLSSAQGALINYLLANHQKVAPKVLGLRISASVDNQLQAAAAAANYDQTFQQVMKSQLNIYTNDLKQAYKLTNGKNGHALLSADYKYAQLLLTQLNTPGQ